MIEQNTELIPILAFIVIDLFFLWWLLFLARKGLEEAKRIWRTIKRASEFIDETEDPAVQVADMIIEAISKKPFDEKQITQIGQMLKDLADKMEKKINAPTE